jgi:hypothetical protein
VVAQNRYVVAIVKKGHYPAPGGLYPRYAYCSRAVGRFHQLVPGGPPATSAFDLQLAGRFLAYEAPTSPAAPISLWDTGTGRHVEEPTTTTNTSYRFPGPNFVLSPNGVAARIVTLSRYSANEVDVLTMRGYSVLDGPDYSPTEALADLQLYDCATGCAPDTTVVAWMHNSEQRYVQVLGGD